MAGMDTQWVLEVPVAEAEAGADALWTAGAAAVVVDELGARVRLIADVRPATPLPAGWVLSETPVDSPESWPPALPPVTVGAWTIHRPDIGIARDDGRFPVQIDPSGAFGSGHHPTTGLALEAMTGLVGEGVTMLDVGCGSGVLSVCAAVSGARCVGLDIDAAATARTRDNAGRNGVSARVAVVTGTTAALRGCFDVVVANMLVGSIEASAPDLVDLTAPEGSLIVSGILDTQVRRAHLATGLAEPRRMTSGDWVALVYGR